MRKGILQFTRRTKTVQYTHILKWLRFKLNPNCHFFRFFHFFSMVTTLKGSGNPIRYFSGGRRPLVQLFMLLCSDIIPWSTHKAHEHITFLCFSPISCGDCHFVWFIYLKLLFRPLGTWIWAPSAAAASFASQHCNCTGACNLAHCHWCCENAFTWGRTV